MIYSLILLSGWKWTGTHKFYCVNELKQWLVNVWQFAAERYLCIHRQVDKATDSVRTCRWTTFWTLIV